MQPRTRPRRQTPFAEQQYRSFGFRGQRVVRSGKILIMLAILLPVLCGFAGLVLDSSLLMADFRNLQHASDAAATEAATTLINGGNSTDAVAAAIACVQTENGFADANVQVNIPPSTGPYAGNASYVEVIASEQKTTYFVQVLGALTPPTVRVRSVAGFHPSTAGAAVDVLEANPPGVTANLAPYVSLSQTLPPLQLGGLEVLGLGQLQVNGAVLDNNQWGGVDQKGNQVGQSNAPPYGAACMPLISLTSLLARNIRVVGGVDNPANYGNFASGQASPLRANQLPVPDPYANLPAPTVASDPVNVSATTFGGVQVTGLPLIGPPTVLNPGVYDWIEIVSGTVVFNPGVYVIRSVNPVTQVALSVVAGTVTAKGVMFYVTNTTTYSPASGAPDASDGNSVASPPTAMQLIPSVVIASLLGSSYSGLNSPASPFNGLLIYQRRLDRRPIVLADQQLLLAGTLQGTVYGKYAQIVFAANGTFDLSLVGGSIRFANILQTVLAPTQPLPPAQDVYLVE
ncbi:MAG TPA: pilus assembly protein TadG-related protein [Planctomycetaceae bacterium]|jgi:Flp pilus assembly protein TadG|nr:pilus assembly protein TadG-related protein [Planctomycetaceae bacterium]